MKSQKEQLKNKILKLTKSYFEIKKSEITNIPGEDYINYSGRIFDFNDGISLVESALDFWLTSGRFSKEFENKLSKYLNIRHSILTNSGSSANLLAMSSLTSEKLGLKKLVDGDEVITVSAGFPTTVNPIYQNNLVPVYCDIDLGTYNINLVDLEKAISKKTKAIILAHTLGNPFDVDVVLEFVKKHDLWLIEDNCDALGSTWDGYLTGTFGHISTQSFYPPHHITMGEGGAVNTNNPLLKKIIESFRDWGRDCWCESGVDNTCGKRFEWELGDLPKHYDHKYIYSHIGYNLKVTDMQASIGVTQLDKLDDFVELRRKNFNYYYKNLKKYEEFFILPKHNNKSLPSWFGFNLTVKDTAPFSRDEIVGFLEINKIATRMLFGGNMVKQPAYKSKNHKIISDLKNTDFVMSNSFWIGVYPGINLKMREYVVEKFEDFIQKYN